jgi:hypothetical protein
VLLLLLLWLCGVVVAGGGDVVAVVAVVAVAVVVVVVVVVVVSQSFSVNSCRNQGCTPKHGTTRTPGRCAGSSLDRFSTRSKSLGCVDMMAARLGRREDVSGREVRDVSVGLLLGFSSALAYPFQTQRLANYLWMSRTSPAKIVVVMLVPYVHGCDCQRVKSGRIDPLL